MQSWVYVLFSPFFPSLGWDRLCTRALVGGCHILHIYRDRIWASLYSLLTPHQDNDTWKCFLLAVSLTICIKLALCILKHMISGGTSKNGIRFAIFSTGLQYYSLYFYIIFLSAKRFVLLFLRPWPVCMHTHQMFPPTFMSAADFVVANVMFSSILPARHQAVKLFQSSEVNASKPRYFARWSHWNAEWHTDLEKGFLFGGNEWALCFEASVHAAECDIYPVGWWSVKEGV